MKNSILYISLLMGLLLACKSKKPSQSVNDPLAQLQSIWTPTDSEIAAEELTVKLSNLDVVKEKFSEKDTLYINMTDIKKSKKVEFNKAQFKLDLEKQMLKNKLVLNDSFPDLSIADWAISIEVKAQKGKEKKDVFWTYTIQIDLRDRETFTFIDQVERSIKKYKKK